MTEIVKAVKLLCVEGCEDSVKDVKTQSLSKHVFFVFWQSYSSQIDCIRFRHYKMLERCGYQGTVQHNFKPSQYIAVRTI